MTPPERSSAAWRLLRASLRGRGREVGGLVAWSLVEALPFFLSGRLLAEAIDKGFLAGSTETGLVWLGVLAASVVAGALATRQVFLHLADLVEPFRDELAQLTVTGSLRRSTASGASADTAGVSRLTEQVDIVREAYGSVLMVVQGFCVSAVSALLGLATLEPVVLLLVLPPLLLGLALFLAALSRMAARQRAMILADERVAETASTLVSGMRDVVACGGEQAMKRAVAEHIDERARATTALARFTAVRTLAVSLGGLVPLVLLLIAAPWLLRHGATTGTLVGAVAYVSQGVHPALQALVHGLGNSGLWLVVTLSRIVESAPGAEDAGAVAPRIGDSPRQHDLRLAGVTFAYGPHADPVIHELDLVVPAGDYLAIAGPSGVGKSTLAGLMTGLLEPQSGEVSIGDIPLSDVGQSSLPRRRVLIPQEAYVFAGTLLENITYLRPDASPAQVNHAVDQLGMRSFVKRLGGFAAELEPHSLSAGERQLVTLLRAYLSPAPIVVLDEATCHLDPATEATVEGAFARRPGTLIVIAHRISSGLRAHRILVLDGTEACLGTHDDLLARSALYRDLVGRWDSGSLPVIRSNGRAQGPPDHGARRYVTRWASLVGQGRRRR